MASFLARRICRSLRCQNGVFAAQRTIHSTATVHKKKGKVVIEDLFGDDAFVDEDLIAEEPKKTAVEAQETTPTPTAVQAEEVKKTAFKRAKLEPAERLARFNKELAFVEPRLGRKPEMTLPHVRKRVWLTLLDLAASEEQLRRIVGMLPKYKEGKGEFPPHFAEAFIRRCQELRCPPLALEVFGNYAKYNVPLNLPAAQWLVHSLYLLHPIQELLIATALYPVYNLPPISEDLPTASMVAAACYKHNTPESIKVAQSLIPHIKEMLENTDVSKAQDMESAKMNKWVAWSLRKVNRAVKRETGSLLVSPELIPVKIRIERPAVEAQES